MCAARPPLIQTAAQISQALAQASKLAASGRLPEAEAICREILRREAKNAAALHMLGAIRTRMAAADEGLELLTRAMKFGPVTAPLHVDLGLAQLARGDAAAATDCYRAAVAMDAGDGRAQFQLGHALDLQGDAAGARAAYEAFVRIDPNDVAAHLNLGNLYKAQQRYDEAMRHYDRALVILPTLAMAYRNIAATLRETGRLHAAAAVVERGLQVCPGDKSLQIDHAAALLYRGDLPRGWAAYEQRFDNPGETGPRRNRPPAYWDGSDLSDRRILVWTEQSPGDEIMHANAVPDIVARAKHCVIECSKRMAPIFARSFPTAQVLAYESYETRISPASSVDVQISAASLGQYLRPTMESFPKHAGYLKADAATTAELREKYLARAPGNALVGISWRSRQVPGKSLRLLDFAPVLKTAGVTFVSLQYGDCAADLADVKQSLGVDVIDDGDVDQLKDMDAYAAQVAAMDLVISISNTTVHTAGAQNIPVWVILPFAKGLLWYWFAGRTDSPWYPSARLYRQDRGAAKMSWADDVIPRVAADFAAWRTRGRHG